MMISATEDALIKAEHYSKQRHSIRLQSGNHFYFDDPHGSTYTVEDIAHNLSKEPRYNGATDGDWGYTVGQHAVNVSLVVPPEFAFEALHHDDAEAFYKDVTTWLKRRIPDYQRELKLGEDALAKFHGLPEVMSQEVKLGDLQLLKMEKLFLFQGYENDSGFEHIRNIPTDGLEELVDLVPWHPRYTKQRYLQRHEELLNARSSS
jgi:hypothetical protein